VTYDSTTRTASLRPNSALGQSLSYSVSVSGAKDLAGNQMASPQAWSFMTAPATAIWSASAAPASPATPDPQPIEVGVKFRSDTAGYIMGVRFYKGATNTGTHVGNLWTSTGTPLGTATFSNETATGWQQVLFPQPVQIAANTTYVASYHTNAGNYASSSGGLAVAVDNAPLHALASGADGPNGLFLYTATSAFPTQTFASTNYWVDVLFSTVLVDTVPPTLVAQTPAPNATKVSPSVPLRVTFSEPVQATSISFVLKDPTNAVVPATLTYDNASRVATLRPNAPLAMGTTYTASVSGAADTANNAMAPVSWSFSTPKCPCSVWDGTATPGNPLANDTQPVEVGTKFRSDLNGYVSGVQFYKGAGNSGPHSVSLWTSTGTLVASTSSANESASGWQKVLFPSPVQISANTTYVVSYHSTTGYAADGGFFGSSGVDSGVLHALANGVDGPNGVFVYSAASAFPNQTFNATNYWVDVLFDASLSDTVPPTLVAQTPGPNATKVSPGVPVTATFSEPVQGTSISFVLKDPTNAVVPATLTYDNASRAATLQPNALLSQGTLYTATLSGAADQAGNVIAPTTWSFTTVSCPCSIWSSTATPGTPAANDGQPIEVGVKFRADSPGYITGIRFYKGTTNTGTHVGNLWSNTGALLASATFTAETASGWQTVTFASPVQVQANTTYIASYHTDVGNYAADGGSFEVGVDNAPLHALANGVDGPNGMFVYSATSAFPNQSFNSTNYWVDVVFNVTLP
jgi:hypothetical protein